MAGAVDARQVAFASRSLPRTRIVGVHRQRVRQPCRARSHSLLVNRCDRCSGRCRSRGPPPRRASASPACRGPRKRKDEGLPLESSVHLFQISFGSVSCSASICVLELPGRADRADSWRCRPRRRKSIPASSTTASTRPRHAEHRAWRLAAAAWAAPESLLAGGAPRFAIQPSSARGRCGASRRRRIRRRKVRRVASRSSRGGAHRLAAAGYASRSSAELARRMDSAAPDPAPWP